MLLHVMGMLHCFLLFALLLALFTAFVSHWCVSFLHLIGVLVISIPCSFSRPLHREDQESCYCVKWIEGEMIEVMGVELQYSFRRSYVLIPSPFYADILLFSRVFWSGCYTLNTKGLRERA